MRARSWIQPEPGLNAALAALSACCGWGLRRGQTQGHHIGHNLETPLLPSRAVVHEAPGQEPVAARRQRRERDAGLERRPRKQGPRDLHDRPKTRRIAEFIGVPTMNFFDVELAEENGRRQAAFGGAKLALDGGRTPENGARKAVLGIRPQHLREDKGGVPCEVRNVEHLGRDLLVTVRLGESETMLYADPSSDAAFGKTMHVSFDMGQAQFFDRESGKSLLW